MKFMVELEQIFSSLPMWTVAETRVTPRVNFSDRRTHIQAFLQRMRKPDA